jgi:predicted O-methyltransferase YrrM
MSRNLALGALGFAAILCAGATGFVATGSGVAAILAAVAAGFASLLALGRKWYRELLRSQRSQTEHLRAVTVLSCALDGPPVYWSAEALAPESLHLILHVTRCLRVRSVLELGSGVSTLYIANLLKSLGGGMVDSFDHEERWARLTEANLADHGLRDMARIRIAALESTDLRNETVVWYSLPPFPAGLVYDLIIVDGPPASREKPHARLPALYRLRHLMGSKSVLVLDDVNRDWEAHVASRWERDFPDLRFRRLGVGEGLLIVSQSSEVFDLLH